MKLPARAASPRAASPRVASPARALGHLSRLHRLRAAAAHRMARRAASSAPAAPASRRPPRAGNSWPAGRRGFPVDAAVVPALLLLVARHLAAFDPPRVLGWRLLHDDGCWPRARPPWVRCLPRPSGVLDRDPIALALAAAAVGFAIVYLVLALAGRASASAAGGSRPGRAWCSWRRPRSPSSRWARSRDGPTDRTVASCSCRSPSTTSSPARARTARTTRHSMLGRQARVSDFWAEHGGNPILHHHAYLPGTHLLMMPFVPLCSRRRSARSIRAW